MSSLDPTFQARLDAFSTFLVKHPRLEEMDQDLMRRIDSHRRYTILAIFGAAGVGKSTVMQRVAEKLRTREPDPSIVPVVVIRANQEDVGASARLDYYRQVLKQLQVHVAVRDRVKSLPLFTNPERKSRDPAEWLEMRDAVQYALTLLRVKVVFVDEAQHLMYVDTPHKPTAQLDWLKTFTEQTNVLHVLVGNFDLYDCCHLNAQAARRMRDVPFHRYHLNDATECAEFATALRTFLEEVPLEVDVNGLLEHWRWFGEWSLGCIGALSDWLVETVDDLYKQGETTLTIKALERHALQPDQRARMEIEARTGERKVELGKTKGEEDLKRLLGNPAPLPGITPPDQSVNGNSEAPASPKPDGRRSLKTPIERAATRDLVGDQVETAKTPKCSFAGTIEIEAKRFLESGVRLVECPNCASTRSLSPRKGVLRFPSHDKRKTHTPNTDQRWAMKEAVWGMVGG
ncbi:MAG: ATP-binding protein [Ktedonobacteraceae bacterium]|nr:ATP-binding protein [Ktedonobacteraceae bacterium]